MTMREIIPLAGFQLIDPGPSEPWFTLCNLIGNMRRAPGTIRPIERFGAYPVFRNSGWRQTHQNF